MTAREIELLRRIVTLFSAVIPATVLLVFVIWGGWFSILALADGEPEALLTLIWCLAAVVGAVSLWAVVLGQRQAVVALGLVFGLLAVLPLSYGALVAVFAVLSDRSMQNAEVWEVLWTVWGLSLPLTAIYWLARGNWGSGEHVSFDSDSHAGQSHHS